jgi:hypothetical protein
MAESILARLDPSQIVYDAYPFVHAAEALTPDHYRELANAFPSMERIVAGRLLSRRTPALHPWIWRSAIGPVGQVLGVWIQ